MEDAYSPWLYVASTGSVPRHRRNQETTAFRPARDSLYAERGAIVDWKEGNRRGAGER